MIEYLEHLPQLLAIVFISWLGYLVIRQGKSSTHIGFFVLAVASASWLLFYLIAAFVARDLQPLFYKLGFSGVIFTGVGAYHFSISYVDFKKEPKVIKICYGIGGLFLALLWFTDLVLQRSLHVYSWGTYPKANVLHPLLLLFFIGMMVRLNILLFKKILTSIKQNNPAELSRAKLVFVSACFFSSGALDFIPNYGYSVRPMGYIFAGIYSTLMAYSILKYKFLDVEIFVKRAAVFAGLFAFVYGLYATFVIYGQRHFQVILGQNEWLTLVPVILIITFSLRPLEDYLTNITEKYLFQKRYDYKQLLKTFTTEVLTVLDLHELANKTVDGLTKIIKLDSCAVFIWNEENRAYTVRAQVGMPRPNVSLSEDCLLVYFLKASGSHLDKKLDKSSPQNELIINEFKLINAVLCLPIIFNEKLIGIISLGTKKSGEDYTLEDIDVLTSLARTEGIAISNALLFRELSATQAEAAQKEKMAVVGTLAAGINHEICNPLGIARGQCEMFLLNYRDGIYKDVPDSELVEKCVVIYEKVINEIDRATGITKRLSSFAKPSKKFELGEVKLAHSVNEVLEILGYELRLDNINVTTDIPSTIPTILGDRKQIEEIIFNIVRNAAQAISSKGSIVIRAFEKSGRVFIDIEDTGGGIPQDKIGQIFNPFYTTKSPGKGTGLGLFIVKQIVERNKGTIAVKSQVGTGTTFTFSFEVAKQSIPA